MRMYYFCMVMSGLFFAVGGIKFQQGYSALGAVAVIAGIGWFVYGMKARRKDKTQRWQILKKQIEEKEKMMIVCVYDVAEGKALVVKDDPETTLKSGLPALIFDGTTYYRTEIIEVRPEPTHGWVIIVSGDCPARAGWMIQ